MLFKILASAVLLSVLSTSYAREVYRHGDWKLDDLSKRNQPHAACIAYTDFEIRNTYYRLEFHHAKDLLTPTDIFIRQDGKGAAGWTAKLNNGKTISFANSGKAQRADLMWNIPQNSSAIIEHLEARQDLKVKPADGSRDVGLQFSADGFKKVKEEMQKRCLAKANLIDAEFEQAILPLQQQINPMAVTAQNIAEMRRILKVGYDVHLKVKSNRDHMQNLRNRFAAQLNEAQALSALIDRLTNTDIPATISNSLNNDQLESSKRDELKQVIQDIVGQKSAVRSAEKVLETARAAIAPFEDEHDMRSSSAGQARNSVNQGASRLNAIDQGINNAHSRINQLSYEAGSLQENSRRAKSDLSIASSELLRADRDYRSYNPQREVNQRLNQSQEYRDANKEIPVLQNHMLSLDRALTEARAKILSREAELRACQARSASLPTLKTNRIPAQVNPRGDRPRPEGDRPNRGDGDRPNRGEGDRPNRGDRTPPTERPDTTSTKPTPTTPSTPTPTTEPTSKPTVDCSSQAEAVREAKSVEADLLGQQSNARQRVRDAQDRVQRAERRIENEVERERSELANRVSMASRRVESIESVLASNEKRIYQINSLEIPQAQNTLRSLQDERPSVQAQYNQDQNVAGRLDQELENFERRVGWDQKADAVASASATLRSNRSVLANSEALKLKNESIITNCQSERVRFSHELLARQQQKTKSESRLVEVNISLEPFEQEKALIQDQATNLKNQLAGLTVEIEGQLPK